MATMPRPRPNRRMNILRLFKLIAAHPLNRASRVQAFSRFLRWQVGSRLLGQPVALPFVNRTHLLTETGMIGSTSNFYFGLHEVDDMAFTLHALREGDLFADVGANIGSYTVLASVVGAQTIAVEPVPETFERLMRNVRFNGIPAETHRCGLSAEPGELRFTADRDAMNRVADADYPGATVTVPVTTLDGLLAGRVPFLIKIDVEGHEPALLEGGARTLSDPGLQAVLMETNANVPLLMARMEQFGFTAHRYNGFERRLEPAGVARQNTIFLRDPAMIAERCRTAPRFSLVNGTI